MAKIDNKQEKGEKLTFMREQADFVLKAGRPRFSLFRSSQPAVHEPADAWPTGIRDVSLLLHSKKKKNFFFFPFSFPLFLTFFFSFGRETCRCTTGTKTRKKKNENKTTGSHEMTDAQHLTMPAGRFGGGVCDLVRIMPIGYVRTHFCIKTNCQRHRDSQWRKELSEMRCRMPRASLEKRSLGCALLRKTN